MKAMICALLLIAPALSFADKARSDYMKAAMQRCKAEYTTSKERGACTQKAFKEYNDTHSTTKK
ncbi:hypothetical protein ACKC9G_09545 [Pokkaliibacter sp. CJK22405]|uniref:hypothetical protein n=1 Tax=Pokkaliibacter sp. CJK22405 TaxID=3384615 RepID=UPI003984EB49